MRASGAVRPTTIGIAGLGGEPGLAARIKDRVGGVVGRLRVTPVAAHVAFFDDDGPKGGRAIRCAITVQAPYQPSIRVEETAQTRRTAFAGALEMLDRLLERYRVRQRESRRRPKKYYVAKRLLWGGGRERSE